MSRAPSAGPPESAEPASGPPQRRPDLRMVLLAVSAWAGALAGSLLPVKVCLMFLCVGACALLLRARRGRGVLVLLACLASATAVGCSAMLRVETNRASPIAVLAEEEAFATVTLLVTSDPVLRDGEYGGYVLLRGRATRVTGRGEGYTTHVPVLVIGDHAWRQVQLGSRVRGSGRLRPAEGPELAGVLSTNRPPRVLERPGDLLDGAAAVRAGVREAVAPAPAAPGALVPALVMGDDQQMPEDVTEAFRVSGLTHLLAVSGTNLTLVVGFVLVVARWAGVRARGLVVVGALGVVGFVLLARTEPSVVRAAAMGSVALLGMGSNGREKGVRALGVAVFGLLLHDPWLALSVGFLLSSLATAGILFLAPPMRDAMMHWLPRWVAEAVSVPLAAQLACTPVVAAISGKVSLVAVAANLLAAPAVGPATVLGLAGGLVALLGDAPAHLLGTLAGWFAWWIVAVAQVGAAMPAAAVDWAATAGSVTALTGLCLALALLLPHLLARRLPCLLTTAVLTGLVVVPVPRPGWPPEGWVMVACDVGQGDALVLNAGAGRAVVVDAGPDPELADRCLDRLDVRAVPLVVLTHFHADHVDGLPGILADRPVGRVAVSPLPEPAEGAAAVRRWTRAAGVPVRVPEYGERRRLGPLTWQVVGPSRLVEGEGSAANNASLTLLAITHGVRILLTGDLEPEAQQLLRRTLTGLRVDVLKVPHHGSRHQDARLLTGLGARVAVVSVGAENDYGHPADETLATLRRGGMLVRRTDLGGAVAVTVDDGRLEVVTWHRLPR